MGPTRTPLERRAQYIGIGCVTTAGGTLGGAMVAVLVAKLIGFLTRCTPNEGLPACDWHIYAGWGALNQLALPFLSVVTLAIALLWLKQRANSA